jgi:MFS family permease
MTDQRPSLGARDVLRIPDFRRLFVAQAISDVGDGLTFLTLLLTVNQLTHSTAALAIMSIAVALPPVTIGLVAGAYADRLDRRRIMLISDTLRGALVLGFIAVATIERLPLLYALAFIQAAIGTFFSPARGALIPRVVPVEGLLAANSISQISRVIASLIGTGLAGVIVGVTGAIWPSFVLDAVTFFASVVIVYGVTRSVGIPEPAGADGLGAINVLFVPFLVNELHETPIWAGPIEGAQTLSMILAGSLVAALATRLRPTSIITGALVGVAVICGLLSIVPNVLGLMAVLFAVGWFVTPLQAAATTIMQSSTADAIRGRVFAAFQAVTSTTTIVSTAAAGIVADVIGVRMVIALGGIVVVFGAIAAGLLFAADRTRAAASTASGTDREIAPAA